MLSHVWLFVAQWNVACQTSLSTEFSRQEYWSGLPFPTPGDCLNPEIKPLASPSLAGRFFLPLSHLESHIQGLPQPITTSAIILRLWSMKRLKLKNKKARLKLKKAGKTIRPIKVKVKSLSRVQLFATPWSVAYQASPSVGFPRQEYWSGVPLPYL